jgi:curved DNA-binding protein
MNKSTFPVLYINYGNIDLFVNSLIFIKQGLMAGKNYYSILEIKESASFEEIKTAYRKMALKYHPDKNPGNKEFEEKIKEINEAYGILSNPQKRAQYDAQRSFGSRSSNFSGFDPMRDFDDIFQEIFKHGGRGRPSRLDVLAELTIEEFEFGANFKFSHNNKTYRLKIPRGLPPDHYIKYQLDTGEHVRIILKQKTHEHFEREYFDLTVKVPLTYGEICNGLDIELNILNNKILVNIPANMKFNSLLRIKNQGMWDEEDQERGDLYLRLVPKAVNLSKEDIQQILKAEKKSESKDPDFISKKKLK